MFVSVYASVCVCVCECVCMYGPVFIVVVVVVVDYLFRIEFGRNKILREHAHHHSTAESIMCARN